MNKCHLDLVNLVPLLRRFRCRSQEEPITVTIPSTNTLGETLEKARCPLIARALVLGRS